jgi:DNA-binding transcriptional LysR family regulator
LELRQLKTFQMVGKLLSFNRAAEHLHYAQSTVSAQIKALEEEFGVPLFDRLGKKIVLTGAGDLLMQYSEKLLTMGDETKAQVSGWEEPQGVLTLRVPQTIGICLMPEVFREFHKAYPKVGISVNSCALDPLKQELQAGVTDLAFLIAEYVSAAELVVEPLGCLRIVAICAPEHPASTKTSFSLQNFHGETVLLPKYDCSYKKEFERELTENKIQPGTKVEINSIEMIKQCVLKGIGITIIPEIFVRDEIRSGHLNVIPWPDTPLEKAILMLWHKDKWISPMLEAFIETARAKIQNDVSFPGE